MTHINQRLPLRVAPLTPSRIDTADGFSVSVEWRNTDHENPYGDAEEFAAFITKAVNCHAALLEALREIAEADPEDVPQWALRDIAEAAIAKAEVLE